MRRNEGRSRLRRCANRLFSVVPLYSSPLRVAHGEAHRRCAATSTPSSLEQRQEVRVGAVVADDEAGVDGALSSFVLDLVRVRVPADVVAGFENA